MKSHTEKNISFFDFISPCYDFLFKRWLSKLQMEAINAVPIKNNFRILDAGCGTGELLLMMHNKNKNLEIYGIDVSEGMLGIAGKKLKGIAKLKNEPVEKTSFKDNFFDCIFSTEAFHHYSEHKLAMKSFYRTLKKGGRLVMVDFDFGGLLNYIFNKIEPANSKVHSAEELMGIFKKHNFREIRQRKIGLFSILTIGKK